MARSTAVSVGAIAAPIGAFVADLPWALVVGAAVVAAIAGSLVGSALGRILFPAPPGQTVIVRRGRPALGIALKTSLFIGWTMAVIVAVAVAHAGGLAAAGVALLVGVVVAAAIGCGAALL